MATSTRRGTGAAGTNWTSLTNAYDAGSATFASNANTTVGAQSIEVTGYGFSADLTTAGELLSVQATVRQYYSNAARYGTPTVQAYLGTTPLGTAANLTSSTSTTNTDTVTISGVKLSDIIDSTFKMVYSPNRTATQTANANLDYIDVIITFTAGKSYWGTLPL
jgi:hypothetical protein